MLARNEYRDFTRWLMAEPRESTETRAAGESEGRRRGAAGAFPASVTFYAFMPSAACAARTV
jgi:hypothetical protein